MKKWFFLLFVVAFFSKIVNASDNKGRLNFRSTKVVLLLDDYLCSTDQWIYCQGFKNWISGNETCIFDSVKVNKGQHQVELNFSIPYIVDSKLIFGKRGPLVLEIVTEPDSVLVMQLNDGDFGIKKAMRGNAHNQYYEFESRNRDFKLRYLAMDDSEGDKREILQQEWFRYLVECLGRTDNGAVASSCIASLRVYFPSRMKKELDELMRTVAERFRLNRNLWHYAGISSGSPEKYGKPLPSSSAALCAEERLKEIMAQAEQIDTLDTSIGNKLFVSFLDSVGNRQTPQMRAGEYVLVDFWASWCKPCRQEMPILKQAVKKYKDRFSVFSVSLDVNRYAWQKAIEAEGIQDFTHVLGVYVNGRPLRLVQELGIKEIPRNFLIDDQMRIVAKDLRGEELIRTLDGLLGK